MTNDEYQHNKADVKIMLHWLRINIPTRATPENAAWLLNQRLLHIESLDTYHPDVIEDMLCRRDQG